MKKTIKIGYIGLGRRGMGMLKNCFSEMCDVKIATICDLKTEKMNEAVKMLTEKGRPAPKMTTDYHDILRDNAIDAVVIMTSWKGRSVLANDSMKAGKYTAVEVGCAYDISECYTLIDTYEATKAPLMMLENCCYSRREMMALRVLKEGMFGKVEECNGGYHHYLPECDLMVKKGDGYDTEHYRLPEYVNRNCENYPTHELGPIMKVLGINRGNRLISLSSFATGSDGLKEFMRDHITDAHPLKNAEIKQGDIITTMIRCANGELIRLTLDTTLPRPYYSRNFTVRGTKGMCEEVNDGHWTFFFEGMEEGVFNNSEEIAEKYEHPLYREYRQMEAKGGHGGIDWLVVRAFVESVKNGTNTPIDAYDTVTLMAIAPLSEASIATGSMPVAFPDFTRGKWFSREPVVQSKYCLDDVIEEPDTPIFPTEG